MSNTVIIGDHADNDIGGYQIKQWGHNFRSWVVDTFSHKKHPTLTLEQLRDKADNALSQLKSASHNPQTFFLQTFKARKPHIN